MMNRACEHAEDTVLARPLQRHCPDWWKAVKRELFCVAPPAAGSVPVQAVQEDVGEGRVLAPTMVLTPRQFDGEKTVGDMYVAEPGLPTLVLRLTEPSYLLYDPEEVAETPPPLSDGTSEDDLQVTKEALAWYMAYVSPIWDWDWDWNWNCIEVIDFVLHQLGGVIDSEEFSPPRIGASRHARWFNILDSSRKRQRVPGKELQLALQALFSEKMEILACIAKQAAKLVRMAHASSLQLELSQSV